MSDADDSGFDKEAERERLREKYEHEQADREAAQQMSDLLLKGATMTNAHCGQCGSPIFRVDGTEFCPNCDAEDGDATESRGAASTQDSPESEQPQGEPAGEPSPDEQLTDVIAGDEADDGEPTSTDGTSMTERAAASVQSAGAREQPSQASDDAGADPARSGGDRRPATEAGGSTASSERRAAGDASLADAQQSLLNAITHHARTAADADPRTARDHLEAASEAAEALAEISQ